MMIRNSSVTKSTGSFLHNKTLLNEPSMVGLQRETESYIRKVEQEKRRYMAVEEIFAAISAEATERKRKLEQKEFPMKAEHTRMMTVIVNLENQIGATITKYNEIIARNNKLRDEIDILRRERTAFLEVYRSMQMELSHTSKETVTRKESTKKEHDQVETTYNRIVNLRNKNEKDKTKYFMQFEELERARREIMKKRDGPAGPIKGSKEKTESIDTHTLLKRRLQKIIFNNKEKSKIVERYIKSMKVIEEAFQEVKEASGIGDIEEIVTTFIKSEEQNLQLMNYASLLLSDIDTFEEMNKERQKEYEDLVVEKREREQAQTENVQDQERRRIQGLLDSRKAQIEDLRAKIASMSEFVEGMLVQSSQSPLQQFVIERYNYDAGVTLNDNNVEQFLAELEDYSETLLIYLAKERETPEKPMLKALKEWKDIDKSHDDDYAQSREVMFKDIPIDGVAIDKEFMRWEEMQTIASDSLSGRRSINKGINHSGISQSSGIGVSQSPTLPNQSVSQSYLPPINVRANHSS